MVGAWKVREGEARGPAGAFQFERLAVKVTPWRLILTAAGVGAYALGLIAFLPAEAAVGARSGAVGTVWDGEAAHNGFGVGWRFDPLDSLARLGGAVDLKVRGPDTELTGQVVRGFGRSMIRDLQGTASARLIQTPSLPFTCDAVLTVRLERFAIEGRPEGRGSVASAPGDCVAPGGVQPLPALTGVASADPTGSTLTFTPAGGGAPVVRAKVTPQGRLAIALEPAAVGVIPGVGAPATVETEL